jgi:hypothetical protein
MDTPQFDRLTRALADTASRRQTIAALFLGGTAIACVGNGAVAKKKHHKKKVTFNDFGCVNVGGFCKNDEQCCSGVCQGKKGKKRCQEHDSGGCQAGTSRATCGGEDVVCTTTAGFGGLCDTTTGNAGFCGLGGDCQQCARDADCQASFGPQAACVVCTGCPDGTACSSPNDIA